MTNGEDSQYTVGYGKPPEHSRFKKGSSGNPKGRPRKGKSFKEEIETELRSLVSVTENGVTQKISKRKAIAKRQVLKAAGGDPRATELIWKMTQNESGNQDALDSLVSQFRERNQLIANTKQPADERRNAASESSMDGEYDEQA
jgi:hypothetical protein